MGGAIKKHLKGNDKLFVLMKHTITVLIGVFVFFNPFPHTTTIKEICFYLSMLLLTILILSKKVKLYRSPLLLPFALFVMWVFIGLFFALDKSGSVHDFYSHLLRYIILYYIIITFFSSKQHLVTLAWIIVISATIFSIGLLYYYYVVLGHTLSTRLGVSLIQITINRITVIIIFAILLSLNLLITERHLYRKTFLLLAFFFLFTAVVMTQLRSAVLALFLSIGILLYKTKNMLAIFYLALLLIVFTTPVHVRFFGAPIFNDRNLVRVKHHLTMFEVIKDYPVFGIGFGMGTYKEHIDFKAYRKKLSKDLRARKMLKYPHSMLADIAARTGIVGLISYCSIMFVFLNMCINSIRHGKEDYIKQWSLCMLSAFIMFLFIGFFEPMFVHMIEVVFFTILSMGTIVWKLNTERVSTSNVECKNKTDKNPS